MSAVCELFNIFDQTLRHHRIRAKALSDKTGVSTSQISDFRNGRKAMSTETLDRLLKGMEELAPGSREYFASLMAGKRPHVLDLESQICAMNQQEIAKLLVLVANRFDKDKASKTERDQAAVMISA